jgi:hypothetical protein
MSKVANLTAQGVLDEQNIIVFGIQIHTNPSGGPDPPPPTGDLLVTVRDDATAGGSGVILTRLFVSQDNMTGQRHVTFPAGVRVTKGVAVNVTANGHHDFTVIIDYA